MSHEIISASAGTGKTHTLTKRVVKLIADGKVQADRMLITTFSIKAAEELRGRVRQELLKEGHSEAARKLPLSRIGTVNSLCDQFVRENAYELGISPRVQVAEPEWIDRILEECIAQAATGEELEKLADWTLRLSGDLQRQQYKRKWERDLRHIIDLARSNHLTAMGLEESKKRSVQSLKEILPSAGDDLVEALSESVKEKLTKGEINQVGNRRSADAIFAEPAKWSTWQMQNFKSKHPDLAEICDSYLSQPKFQADMKGMIEVLFDLALRALQRFEERKRELGVIDFIDQEVKTLQLLKDPEFLKENTGRFDLLMVDEFQDTSPLQLDIFLRLKPLVSRCIWVGDPKQAIYSFRGADPALMQQVLSHLPDAETSTLDESWRSREELCKFTSDLFVPAYQSAQSFKEDKVRITAAPERGSAPEGCRASVEAWKMTGNKDKVQPATLAGSVRALLQEQEADLWVPKEQSDQLRLIQAKDVALLCKYNRQCNAVAANLKALGIPVRIGNSGLLNEPEVAFLLACLTLWQEPKHSLSIRTLQRLLTDNSDLDADGWLENCLNQDEAVPGIVEDIRNLRSEHPHAGVEEAFLHLQSQINLFECCQRWGDAEQRLANLRRLYGHLQSYAQQCKGPGDPVILAGFQIYLQQLAKDDKDETGIRSGNAVSVYTLHGSKGLEWPVVILFGWDDCKTQNAFQVSLQTEGSFDVENPLSGRWIRYWPNPLSSGKGKLFDLCPTENQQLQTKEEKDWLNVAYVGMTRAASQLILTVPEKGATLPYLDLDLEAVEPPVPEAEDPTEQQPITYPGQPQDRAYPPARKTPSSSKGLGEILTEVSLGDRLPLTGKPDMDHIGNMLHSWFALTLSQGVDVRSTEAHLTEWDCTEFLQPESLKAMHDRLYQWIESRFPKAGIHTELPFRYTEACGTEINGIIDLAIETQDGWIIIDHKSFPGNSEQTRKKAQSFAEQLACYAQALTQITGKPVLETWIHLPVVGKILRVNHQKNAG